MNQKNKILRERIDKLANIIWCYQNIKQRLSKVDLILILCSFDIRVAEYAAKLYLKGYAPLILFSGGQAHQDDLLATGWKISEAVKFSRVAIKLGVPSDRILIEDKSTNTGENIIFSYKLLKYRHIKVRKIIIAQKPFMLRRAYGTFKKQWLGARTKIVMTSPPFSFKNYFNRKLSKDKIINIMIGDLQRQQIYAEQGFQIKDDIPLKVWQAYKELVKIGYNKHLYVIPVKTGIQVKFTGI